jgi:hypothetical protein
MELIAELSKHKKAAKNNDIIQFQTVESIDNTYFSAEFMDNLLASVADAEDPQTAANDVLEALKEVTLAEKKGIKLQSAREFLSEF